MCKTSIYIFPSLLRRILSYGTTSSTLLFEQFSNSKGHGELSELGGSGGVAA